MQEDGETKELHMARPSTVTGILAVYTATLERERAGGLPKDVASYARVRARENAPIRSLIRITKRGILRWRFAPSRTSFYSLGHVAVGTSPDGFTLILEQVRDRLAEHFDEYSDARYTHSLTILDTAGGQEVFFSTDQGFGWDHTPKQLDEMSAEEKTLHRSDEIAKLFALVVGDQNRHKPRRR